MKINKILAVIIPGILLATTTIAQTVNAQTAPRFNAVQQSRINTTLDTRYSGINKNSIRWETNQEGYFEGSFNYKDREYVTTFDDKGNWISTSERLGMNDLPQNFRTNLSTSYSTDEISRIDKITNNRDNIYYNVTLRGQEEPLQYDTDGNILNDDPDYK